MNLYITRTHNLSGVAAMAHEDVLYIAKGMGFRELGLYLYHVKPDFAKEMPWRLEGITASIESGDIVVFQYPSWNGVNYDNCLVDKIREKGAGLIIFVQDFQYLMFGSGQSVLDYEMGTLNKADLLILPSEKFYDFLIGQGLNDAVPVVYQTIWDAPSEVVHSRHGNHRRIFFTGNPDKFPFLNGYGGKTPIVHYGRMAAEGAANPSYHYEGFADTVTLTEKLSEGGFGLVWAEGAFFDRYYRLNQPYKIGSFLAAGIPVIVRKGCTHEPFVQEHGIGIVAGSLQEADERVQNLSDEEFDVFYANVKNIQTLILNGSYTRRTLQDSLCILMQARCRRVETEKLPFITVWDKEGTLDFILKNHCSVARFGNGEINLIGGSGIPYQEYDDSLAEELRQLLSQQSDASFLVCLPDVFWNIGRYNESARAFWKQHLEHYRDLYRSVCTADWYGSAFIARPYIDLADKSGVGDYISKLRSLWENRSILIVEGELSRSGVGNDLFDNAKEIKRILCPPKNAYAVMGEIEKNILLYGTDCLVLLMLGPTAKVLARRLSRQGIWAIDLGHIDSEYEWFLMKADSKVKLPGKHTAEHNFDENICLEEDETYESQIVARIGLES